MKIINKFMILLFIAITMISSCLVIHAKEYESLIKYDTKGGTPATLADQIYRKDNTYIHSIVPSKDGFTFAYWGEPEIEAASNKNSITYYGYKKATYKIENVKTDGLEDTYTPWYKNVYKYDYDYKKTASSIPTNFDVIRTAGPTTVWSASTNGKTWHITEVFNDIDCAYISYDWINYWQPETELRVNGVKKLQIQKNSSDVTENGHKTGLDIEANGTISIYSYGATGNNRNVTWIGGGNEIKYYTIESKVSGWVFNSSEIKDAIKINSTNSTGYVLPSWSNETGWRISKPYDADQNTKPVSVIVSFDANGGTPINSINYSTRLPSSSDYVKNGYRLVGWSTKPSATSADYKCGANISTLNLKEDSNIVLYAVWTPDPAKSISNWMFYPGEKFDKNIDYNVTLNAIWVENDNPNIKFINLVPEVYKDKEGGALNWRNTGVDLKIQVTDDFGISMVNILHGNRRVSTLATFEGEPKWIKERFDDLTRSTNFNYWVDNYILESDDLWVEVVDIFGEKALKQVIVPNIDKVKPKLSDSVVPLCGAALSGNGLTLVVTDDRSGVDEWEYDLVYTDIYGNERNDLSKRITSNNGVCELNDFISFPESESIGITLNIKDKAGNIYSLQEDETSCKVNYRKEYVFNSSLTDYNHVFGLWDQLEYDVNNISDATAKSFINLLGTKINDDPVIKSAYNYIMMSIRDNNLSHKEALNNFFRTFNYNKQTTW